MTSKSKVVSLIFFLIIVCYSLSSFFEWKKTIDGNKIVQEIELYKMMHGSYPNDFNDIGLEPDNIFGGMATNISGTMYCYERTKNSYLLWYGTAVGEGMYYHPETKKLDVVP